MELTKLIEQAEAQEKELNKTKSEIAAMLEGETKKNVQQLVSLLLKLAKMFSLDR